MKFKKKHKPITKKFWQFLRFMPVFLRKRVIRSQFQLSYNLSSDYTFKAAETEQEVEEALNIVYEAYTLLGYIDQRPEKIHFNAYLCMPTTTILIIKYKEEVIGTMSIVPDSPQGLPSEKTWDISKIKSKDKKIAEISSLTIKKSHKGSNGNILFTLCKLMYSYCVDILELDGIVIAATVEVEPFYTDLLMFKTVVNSTGQEHSSVKGNKSTCCYLDLNSCEKIYYKEYGHKKSEKNLYKFFIHFSCPNIILPEKPLSIHALHLNKNRSITKMLQKFPDLQNIFTKEDKLMLSNLDPLSQIEHLINFDTGETTRVYPRISIRSMDSYLYHGLSSTMQPALMVDVSRFGFGLKLTCAVDNANINDKFVLIFEINKQPISIHAELQWFKLDNFGFIVSEKSHADWENFIKLVFAEISLPVDQIRINKKKSA